MDHFDEELHTLSQKLLSTARKLRQSVEEIPAGADKPHLEDLGQQIEGKAEKLLAQQIKPVLIVPRAERKL
jgi:hypothetical protein